MLLIVEIIMFLGGLWTAGTGKLPSWLVGGGKFTVEGLKARLLGLWVALPLPAAFLAGILLGLLLGQDAATYAALTEVLIVVGVALVAVVAVRLVRQPLPARDTAGTTTDKTAPGR